jgi:acetyl-CoA decarbonylase/synthase complex subunit gamma
MLATPAGRVPRVASTLTTRDRLGAFKVRWGVGRMGYTVPPGLYALGNPDAEAPALVTANYKLSFDILRRALAGRDAWILVLDTRGVNVWCAAGKGTFGTGELIARLEATRLGAVVRRRRLILPQLGAPGVAAHEVLRRTGFRVVYGPVMAADLPAFLDAGGRAAPEMRRKTFPLAERLVLIPVELVQAARLLALPGLAFFFLAGLGADGGYWAGVRQSGTLALAALAAALASGCVLFPILLPWLPGRAFALKGLPLGLLAAGGALGLHGGMDPAALAGRLEILGWLAMGTALTSFLALNFTGASTYTSLSGVKKEMRLAVPLQIAAGAAGLLAWIAARLAG